MSYPDFAPGRPPLAKALLKEGSLILLIAVLLTGATWMLRPQKLPVLADPAVYDLELEAPVVELGPAQEFFAEGAHLFVDTRPGDPRGRDTIAGALVLRENSFDDDLLALFDILYPEDPIIVFGQGDMTGPNNVAGKLLARGYNHVQILRGGVKAWQDAGGELGSAFLPAPAPADEEETW